MKVLCAFISLRHFLKDPLDIVQFLLDPFHFAVHDREGFTCIFPFSLLCSECVQFCEHLIQVLSIHVLIQVTAMESRTRIRITKNTWVRTQPRDRKIMPSPLLAW